MNELFLKEKAIINNNITFEEALLLIMIANNFTLDIKESSLVSKGLITKDLSSMFSSNEWRITNKGTELINSIIIDSDKCKTSDASLENLATKLKEIFPKGKKEGTNYYWADGTALIIRRLKLFFKKYGEIYSEEQIIQAATDYVRSFNGDYTYMKLLKYFILKEKIGVGGDIEGESELINHIENANQLDNTKRDWMDEIY